MALTTFDIFNQVEIPTFSLANPDGKIIYNLGTIYDRNFELRYNTLSKLTFSAPSKIDGVSVDYYDYLQHKRLVLVDGIGEFVITDIQITDNGIVKIKNITCESSEKNLSSKKISSYNKQMFFYAPSNPVQSLLDDMLGYIPTWSINEISASLVTTTDWVGINRSYNVTDKTLYDFLTNEVSQTCQCVFVFDTINKTISAYTLNDATTPTDIFISFDNLIKSVSINESTEEVVTALTVLGGNDLSINQVNPLGTDIIYEFGYYKTTEWMTQELIDALDAWEIKVANYQQEYADTLTSRLFLNQDLNNLYANKTSIESEISAKNAVRDVQIQAGQSTSVTDSEIAVLQISLTEKENEITDVESQISLIDTILEGINQDLSFQNEDNFTSEQFSDLTNFIIGNTYTNTNFIQTDETDYTQEQQQAQMLYDQARGIWNQETGEYDGGIISKISQPRYTFEIDSANFLFLKEYEPFIEQLSLGCTITIELEEGRFVEAVLLGIDFNYDNPESFKLLLSNRLRLDNEEFQYSDLFGSIVDSSTTTSFNSQKWNSTSNIISSQAGEKIVTATGYSTESNICLFSNTEADGIKDSNAMYVAPTAFTPDLQCSDATFTYAQRNGIYSIIGRVCFYEAYLFINGRAGAATGQVYMTLPATSTSASGICGISFPGYGAINVTGVDVFTTIVPSSACAVFWQNVDNSASGIVSASMVGTTSKIYLSGNYFIN